MPSHTKIVSEIQSIKEFILNLLRMQRLLFPHLALGIGLSLSDQQPIPV